MTTCTGDRERVLIDFGAARVAPQQRTHTQVLTDGYAPIEQYTSHGGGILPGCSLVSLRRTRPTGCSTTGTSRSRDGWPAQAWRG